MTEDNFAALKILSKTACLLTYKKEKIWASEFLKFVLKGMGGILRMTLIAFILCFSKGSVQQDDYNITTLYSYRSEVFTGNKLLGVINENSQLNLKM